MTNELEDRIKKILAAGISITQLRECIANELAYQKDSSNMLKDQAKALENLFEYFEAVDHNNPKLDNRERFKTLEQNARKKGDQVASVFAKLFVQQDRLQALFDATETPAYKNAKDNNERFILISASNNVGINEGDKDHELRIILTELQDSVIELGRAFDACDQELLSH